MIYNVVLISAEQQSDSVIHIYTSFFFFWPHHRAFLLAGPRIDPGPSAVRGRRILTTRPPGNSHLFNILFYYALSQDIE